MADRSWFYESDEYDYGGSSGNHGLDQGRFQQGAGENRFGHLGTPYRHEEEDRRNGREPEYRRPMDEPRFRDDQRWREGREGARGMRPREQGGFDRRGEFDSSRREMGLRGQQDASRRVGFFPERSGSRGGGYRGMEERSEREPRRGTPGAGDFGGGNMPHDAESGRFYGKGPKGYQRSDERVRDEVCERLALDPDLDASDIEVQVKGGEVLLTGTVDRRGMRHHAEDLICDVFGVRDVENRIRVRREGEVASGERADARSSQQQAQRASPQGTQPQSRQSSANGTHAGA